MTKPEAAQLILAAIVNWPTYPFPNIDAMSELWHQTLGDVPFPAAHAALLWWIADDAPETNFPPGPGNIRDRAEKLVEGHMRHDSYAFRVGLDRAVHRALVTGEPLNLTLPEGEDRVLEIAG